MKYIFFKFSVNFKIWIDTINFFKHVTYLSHSSQNEKTVTNRLMFDKMYLELKYITFIYNIHNLKTSQHISLR